MDQALDVEPFTELMVVHRPPAVQAKAALESHATAPQEEEEAAVDRNTPHQAADHHPQALKVLQNSCMSV